MYLSWICSLFPQKFEKEHILNNQHDITYTNINVDSLSVRTQQGSFSGASQCSMNHSKVILSHSLTTINLVWLARVMQSQWFDQNHQRRLLQLQEFRTATNHHSWIAKCESNLKYPISSRINYFRTLNLLSYYIHLKAKSVYFR